MDDATKAWIKDALERVAWTFVQGFAAALLLADQLNIDAAKAAALAGLMAAVAAVKAVAANRLGGETAQLGAKTYSYTQPGPGSAGSAVSDDGQANLGTVVTVLLIILLVILIVRLV